MQIVMDKSRPQEERDQAARELREQISKAMPHVAYEDARASIHQWWLVDRANAEAA
jgi:hypothetical protein